jgi:arginine decarboxylase
MRPPKLRKAINEVKGRVERARGPIEHDQSAVPLEDAIRDYWRSDRLSFSIPAHAGGRGPVPEAARWTGVEAFRADLPMSHGLDTRDRAWGVQRTAEDLFAEAVGADRTFFSTNGSSMSARGAISSVVSPGETIVMARNGHKSAFSGLVQTGALPGWVRPEYDDELELAHGITPEALEAALVAYPEAKAAMVFSPTYYGVSADLAALVEVAHRHGVPLVTDDAWGLVYSFSDRLPRSGLQCGADLSFGSVHKSLSGFSQTSVLSVQGDLIDRDRLQRCFELEESTSASALLISSIDGARRQFVRDGDEHAQRAIAVAELLRRRVDEIDGLHAIPPEALTGRPGASEHDPRHVIIELGDIGITGYTADDWLRDEHGIDVELADHRRLMALVTYAHDEADVERLIGALTELASARRGHDEVRRVAHADDLVTEQIIRPRDAFHAPSEMVSAREAADRVSGDIVTPYPPGIPLLAPGERITEPILEYLEDFVALGGFIEGATDQELDHFRVVAE